MKGIRQTHNINETRGKRQTQQQKKRRSPRLQDQKSPNLQNKRRGDTLGISLTSL